MVVELGLKVGIAVALLAVGLGAVMAPRRAMAASGAAFALGNMLAGGGK